MLSISAFFLVAPVLAGAAILALRVRGVLVRAVPHRFGLALPLAADVGIAIAAPHLDADRRADETELLAQLVDQEALVGEVERRRHVGEEEERRRRDAGLRRVHDADVSAAWADRRIRGGHLLEELVERRRRH